MDHLLPLYVREAGGLVVYVPDAVATDRPISGLREQLRNRTRTATRGIRANLSMVGRLAPWRRPGPALAIWSHKLLRWATPWFVLVVAVAGLVLGSWAAQPVYLVAPSRSPLGPLLAGVGAPRSSAPAGIRRGWSRSPARSRSSTSRSRLGWLNVIRGREIEVWHRAEFRVEG